MTAAHLRVPVGDARKRKPNRITNDGSKIGDKSIEQWDREWRDVPGGFVEAHPQLRGKAGLYRANRNGETMVIGVSSERRGGRLAKRLSDFRRPSGSGRNHRSGRYIRDNLDSLSLQVLVTGTDAAARDVAKRLKKAMIARHRPTVNVPAEIVHNIAFR